MMRHRRLHLAAALAAALVPVAALVPTAAGAQRRDRAAYRTWIDTTVALARGGTVEVGALAVDVVVDGSERSDVRIRAYAERGRIATSLSAARLTLRVEPEGDRRDGRIGDATIQLVVPLGTRVRATTTAGDVTITGTRGEVEASANAGDIEVHGTRGLTTLRTIAGDATATDVDGDVAASTGVGDLVLRDVRGDVRATTVGGDLVLAGVAGRVVAARSTRGDILVDGAPAPDARYELTTHSGDVVLALRADTRADVVVQTYTGSLDTAFPIVIGGGVGASRPRTFEFPIGGGGARIRVETFSGDVILRRDAPGAGDRPDRDDRSAPRAVRRHP